MRIENINDWGDLLDYVGGFEDVQLIGQIRTIEHIIECDTAKECVLYDTFLVLYDHLRDECVRRIAERM